MAPLFVVVTLGDFVGFDGITWNNRIYGEVTSFEVGPKGRVVLILNDGATASPSFAANVRITKLDVDPFTRKLIIGPNGSPILEGMSANYQDIFFALGWFTYSLT